MKLKLLTELLNSATENMNALKHGGGDLELLEKKIAQLVRCSEECGCPAEAEAVIKKAIKEHGVEF